MPLLHLQRDVGVSFGPIFMVRTSFRGVKKFGYIALSLLVFSCCLLLVVEPRVLLPNYLKLNFSAGVVLLRFDGFFLSSDSQRSSRFFDDMKYSDLTLVCGRREFSCHKFMLAKKSDVFDAMFSHNFAESTSGRVNIEDLDEEAVAEMLRFIYVGQVHGMDKINRFGPVREAFLYSLLLPRCYGCRCRHDSWFSCFLAVVDSRL